MNTELCPGQIKEFHLLHMCDGIEVVIDVDEQFTCETKVDIHPFTGGPTPGSQPHLRKAEKKNKQPLCSLI